MGNNYLHRKWVMRIILFILLLGAVGMTKAQTYTANPSIERVDDRLFQYSYSPAIGSYTQCGQEAITNVAFNYNNCSLAGGSANYTPGQIQSCILSHNTSTGRITVRVKKCSGFFQSGNTGKIIIYKSYENLPQCTSFYIPNSTTDHVDAYFDGLGDFQGSQLFEVYLITSNEVYKQYGGSFVITGSQAQLPPSVTTKSANNITDNSANLRATINTNGDDTEYYFEYGTTQNFGYTTSTRFLSGDSGSTTVSVAISGLSPNTTYYYMPYAENSGGHNWGSCLSFTTNSAGDAPFGNTYDASNVTANSATLSGWINPGGLTTYYRFEWGTSSSYGNHTSYGTLPASNSNHTVSSQITGLQPNTLYYFRLYAYNDQGEWYDSGRTFTTEGDDCYFLDCTSGEIYTAAQYLCERGIVEGIDGYLNPDVSITRAQLAKISLFGLYNGPSNVPNLLVTDYFPSIYPDLQNTTTYYYQAAKALLYLEYGDGRSPFDRDRSCFNPTGTISRRLVLKVLFETFNIAPATSGSNPFSDFPSTESFWGYAKKAYDLGITQNTTFCPYDLCTRGEAFLFLYRILLLIDNNTITKPTPNYDTYDPLNSDFFVPSDLSPQVANAIRGVEYGNFNYYNKNFFNIPGYMNLDFGISYNSYLTEMPTDFYPVQPLGKAWTHTYDMYMNIITDNYNNISYYVFHMQEGTLLIYKTENGALAKYTEGNYYTLTPSTPNANTYTLKSTGQIDYTFTKKSDGIYYLTQIKDRNNNAITISIGSNNNGHYRVNSVSTLGRTLTFSYTSDTLLYYVKDPSNRYVRFYYTDGQMTSLKDAKSQTTHFNYGTLDSEKGLLKEIQLPKGNYVYNDYQRRKLKSMSYYGISTQTHTDIAITPDYQNHTTTSAVTETLTGNNSVTTTYTMNDKNRVTHVTDGANTDVSFEYGEGYLNNPDFLTKKTDNKTGLQTLYGYDSSNGMVSSATFSNGTETHTVYVNYNSFNDITNYTDANNNTTHYGYDPVTHNLISITDALGKTTYIDYDNAGHGVPIRVTNPMGVSIEYGYNNYGNMNEIHIPSLNLTATMDYDGVSRMIGKTDFAGHTTQYTYDNNDNLETITDANGYVTTYHVDANDNVDWIRNAKGIKTNFTYDFNTDFLTQVSFQGATRSYTYNRDGSLNTFTDPSGNTFNYTYNNSGELTSDGYATLQYDSGTGHLWKITKDGKTITYTYDSFDRISSIAYDGKTVSYNYDNNGNVINIVYPGNKTVTYTYDALNRITAVRDWNNKTTSYSYRDDNQLDYYQYPNGVRTKYYYDNSGRHNGISTKRNSGNGSVIAEYSFEFDNMGNHTSESFTEPFEAYPSIPSETLTYNYNNANRLISVGNLSFTYDNNGNTKTRTGRNYNYDVKDNLTSVSGDFTVSYSYDGLGNRRMTTYNGTTTKYVLNLLGNIPIVLMETDANGSAQHYYIYGPSGLISRIDANNNTRYYVYDSRGSTVAMTDATTSANVTHKYQYDDFGKLLQVEEEDENLYRYVGRFGVSYEDQALTFMRARYYDPEIGRFLSEDPIWNTNLYPYAENNPIMRIDPTGRLAPPSAVYLLTELLNFVGNAATFSDCIYTLSQGIGETLTPKDGWNMGITAVSFAASKCGPFGVALSAGLSIGQFIGDVFDEQITNGMAKLIYNIKYKRKQEKQAKSVQAALDARQAAAPTFQIDKEAMDWIFSEADQNAKALKNQFKSIVRSDLPAETKYSAYSYFFKKAHEYMQR